GVYESASVGSGEAQGDCLHACVQVETGLEPRELMAALQGFEHARGRVDASHMKPRPLDLDILLYDSVVMREPELEIPHPRLAERAFVLEPLAELDPDLILPDSGQTVARLCAMMRAVEGRTARRRPETLLSALAAVE
nr:2-amino-4-hydroxy-6-hydroxymethyldihydropteridine diphosphokinase [bacterium]